ncbi:MAG TPA: sigma-54 dependent transcriptional regulator [Candidatus Eisenbacteria bacterium]|nr:sigma-54 dependent transcriptional regulator [Candidatus Eisenbacteria bacterium]
MRYNFPTVLIVGGAASDFEEAIRACLPHGSRCDRAPWPMVGGEPYGPVDLVVAITRDLPAPLGGAFARLASWLGSPVLAVVGDDESDDAKDAAIGADSRIAWPSERLALAERLSLLVSWQGPEVDTSLLHVPVSGVPELVGRHPSFLRSISRIPAAARSNVPVLITGETGTGKELCARAIHRLGPRKDQPFVPVDCASLPDHLIENEIFGHARGAFTDARGDQRGLIAMAEGGTLFLDEVDALSLSAQGKLLRFLQERTYKPLGDDRFLHADVNVLAASNHDLEGLVKERRLRTDLYFRLNVLRIHLEPLRDRRDDIALLTRHFVKSLCAERGLPHKGLSPSTLEHLERYDWPGNVRELFNVVQRAVVFSTEPLIHPRDLLMATSEEVKAPRATFREARARAIETFERSYVEELLRRNAGNVTRAAREAQKDRRAFGRLVKKYSLRITRD